jgi:hypothetical protein
VSPFAHLLILLVSLSSTGQAATLSGTVTDRTSGLALPYVSVVLPELKRGDYTDLHGAYTILKLPEGTWQVQISSIGYLTSTDTLHLGPIHQHSVALLPDPITMKAEFDLPVRSLEELVQGVSRRIHEEVFQPRYEDLVTHRFRTRGTQTLYSGSSPKSGVSARIEYDGKGYYRKPGKIFQVITAYRSADRLGRGFGMHPGAIVDIRKGSLSGKKFDVGPLPLSPEGEGKYKYRLLDTVQMGDIVVHRLSVKPRKRRKPGLAGNVWISGTDYSLVGYDLSLNKHTRRKLGIKELRTYQENALYFDKYWLPTAQTVRIRTSSGQLAEQTTAISNYVLNTTLADSLFAGPRLKMRPLATQRDSTYWADRSSDLDASETAAIRKLLRNDRLPEGWKRLMKK